MKKKSVRKSLLKKVARLLMKLRVSWLFKIRQGDFVLRFYPTSLSRVLWVDQYMSKSCYQEERTFFSRYLRSGDVVIDVGANIGFTSLLASVIVGKDGKVYSVEPHPRTYEFLRGNLTLNGAENVESFNCALGSESGTISLSDRTGDDKNFVDRTGRAIPVDQKRLDALYVGNEPISLLKIDVEGYEKFVIEGAAELLENVRCIHFEAIEELYLRFGYTLRELVGLLVDGDFKILEVHADELYRLGPSDYPRFGSNLVAVRDLGMFLRRTNFSVKSD
ncbi:MAG: FkbM family methyltransferase [Planctomycetota bacterium]|jgi:FkbM family methyltransferase